MQENLVVLMFGESGQISFWQKSLMNDKISQKIINCNYVYTT